MKKLEELNQKELMELIKAYDKYLEDRDVEVLICISEFYYNNMVRRYDGKLRCKNCGELLTDVGICTQKYISYKVYKDNVCIPCEEENLLVSNILCGGCSEVIEDTDILEKLELRNISFGGEE